MNGNYFLEVHKIVFWRTLEIYLPNPHQLLSFPKRTHWTNPEKKKNLVWSTNSSNFVRGLLGFAPIQNVWWNFLQKHHATPKHVEHVRHGRFSVGQFIRSPRDVFKANREAMTTTLCGNCGPYLWVASGSRCTFPLIAGHYGLPLEQVDLNTWVCDLEAYRHIGAFLNVQESSRIMHQNPIDFKTNTSNTHFQVTLS